MANLFNRGGVWYINYRINGKQYRRSTKTGNRKLAEIALKDLELRLFKGKLGESEGKAIQDAEIAEIIRRYLLHVEDNAVPDYAHHVRWHLNRWRDFLFSQGISYANDINVKVVDDFFVSELKNHAPKTKKEYLASLKACLNRAVKWGLLESNPIRDAQPPKRIIRKVQFFSKEEVKQLLESAPYDLRIAIKLLVNTGIRLGELWALRWKDIDFRNDQIWIRAYDEFTPKGKRDRTIPMNPACKKVLLALKSERKRGDVFVYRLTRSYKRLSNKFIRYSRKIGIKGRLHDLRHTFASHLVMVGTPLPVIKELLGHADITTTMVYSHLAPNIHQREIKKISF